MTEASLIEKRETLRRNIFADAALRAVQWACFVVIVCGLALPLAWGALRASGFVPAVVVLALCVGLAWGVKPQGRSAWAQCRDIEKRFAAQR